MDQVSFQFSAELILEKLTFQLPEQGIIGIFGPSGCGKTTFLHLLAGLLQPGAGQVGRLRRDRIGMVFQEDRLIPWLTNETNLSLAGLTRQQIQTWLNRVELDKQGARYPDDLSGGMRRRIALARALAFDCDLLLLDEPFQGMDTELKKRLYPLIRHAAEDKPVLMVSHDTLELGQLAGTIFMASGPPLRLNHVSI